MRRPVLLASATSRHPLFRAAAALIAATVILWSSATSGHAQRSAPTAPANDIQFVFTSDSHYGLTRSTFRGGVDVPADTVNQALVAAINQLPVTVLPADGGLRAGLPVDAIDFVAVGGDIANRAERTENGAIQSAAASWAAFQHDYGDGLTIRDAAGQRTPLLVVPGNHDASNAVGFHRPMTPERDATSIAAIYNRYMHPATPVTPQTYDYVRDKVLYTRDVAGIHFLFLTVWPDSATRTWMERDLAQIGPNTPVIIVTHDQPDAEAKHFTNPNGAHDINPIDQFENLLGDVMTDGTTIDVPARTQHAALETFLRRHPNITAYFHGNSNWNQFYDWTGPGHSIAVHTFRVDSPMKGAFSATDETKLSFQLVTIDPVARVMTVRECLWNADPPHASLTWGGSTTVALSPRP